MHTNHILIVKKGATILRITSDDLKDTLIPNAPIEMQREFVSFVEQVDKSKFIDALHLAKKLKLEIMNVYCF